VKVENGIRRLKIFLHPLRAMPQPHTVDYGINSTSSPESSIRRWDTEKKPIRADASEAPDPQIRTFRG